MPAKRRLKSEQEVNDLFKEAGDTLLQRNNTLRAEPEGQ